MIRNSSQEGDQLTISHRSANQHAEIQREYDKNDAQSAFSPFKIDDAFRQLSNRLNATLNNARERPERKIRHILLLNIEPACKQPSECHVSVCRSSLR